MDAATYAKSVAYTLEKSRFGVITEIFDTLVLALVLFGGVLPMLFRRSWAGAGPDAIWTRALFILLAGVLLSIPVAAVRMVGAVPAGAEIWFQQEHAGLVDHRQAEGRGADVRDRVSAAVGAVVARAAGPATTWWIWGFALMFGFQLLMLMLYPKLILPLFNKLTPLPEGDLRTRLMALGDRTGFRAKTIEVIDGSKRSGHSNAYFTGFGRFRRIVLFDTLIAQLTPEELEAVLAHEIGHYRRGHIPKMIAMSAVMMLGGLRGDRVAGARAPGSTPRSDFPPGEIAPSFLLFGLLSGRGDVLVRAAGESAFAQTRIRSGRVRARRDGRTGGDGRRTAQARAEKPDATSRRIRWFSAFFYSHPTLGGTRGGFAGQGVNGLSARVAR